MPRYNPATIEPKWQAVWEANRTFACPRLPKGRKLYVLDMFPYPSGAGLHVGHPEGYTATDIVCRYRRMKGATVMHPMGWDAFGLPAEQYAKQTGTHPRATTEKNIANFRRQLKMLGFSYDWDRELATTDVDYFRWTQWIFLVFFDTWFDRSRQRGRPIAELPIPAEIAAAGSGGGRSLPRRASPGLSARGPGQLVPGLGDGAGKRRGHRRGERARRSPGSPHPPAAVDAADYGLRRPARKGPRPSRLAREHQALAAELDRPQHRRGGGFLHRGSGVRGQGSGAAGDRADLVRGVEEGARGRSGFPAKPGDEVLRVYTTRPDTLFGATYMVVAPEHPFVERLTTPERAEAVRAYCQQSARKSDLDRTDLAKEKTGVFTGSYAVNPVNGEAIPIWIADYVLVSYGTGAIMAVPAHDTRDFEFARQFDLPIIAVVDPPGSPVPLAERD